MNRSGFTLLEMIAVLVIVGILVCSVYPALARLSERSRQAQCVSNEKQLGLALYQYAQDNDQAFPAGLVHRGPAAVKTSVAATGSGAGWAGSIFSYTKDPEILKCPDDPSQSSATGVPGVSSVSYALNYLLPERHFPDLISPSTTVELFEVTDDLAYPSSPDEGAHPSQTDWSVSAIGDGWPNCGGLDYVSAVDCAANKCMPSKNSNPVCAAVSGVNARHDAQTDWHLGYANYLLADGHCKRLSCESAAITNDGPNPPSNSQLPIKIVNKWWSAGRNATAVVTFNPQ